MLLHGSWGERPAAPCAGFLLHPNGAFLQRPHGFHVASELNSANAYASQFGHDDDVAFSIAGARPGDDLVWSFPLRREQAVAATYCQACGGTKISAISRHGEIKTDLLNLLGPCQSFRL